MAHATGNEAVRHLPPLIMLRAFEAIGRTGSMRRAAEDIAVSHNVVSYHIRNLESWFGMRLVERGPRGITLTAEGQEFHAVVTSALDQIAGAATRLRRTRHLKTLTVWCMPGLASRWLTPRLSQIRQRFPGIEIDVRPTASLPNFRQDAADLMIGFGMPEHFPPDAVPLVRPRVYPVASPAFLESHGAPARIADLVGYPLIHEEDHGQWAAWLAQNGVRTAMERLTGSRLWSANLCIDAAIAGQGITLGFAPLVSDCIQAGQLVELFETDVRLGGYFLVAPPEGMSDPVLAGFQRWILETLV